MSKILSVSVAAYNVEKFIEKNLDSFVNSEVRDKVEVLVIDDGSKDKTAEIVSVYENKYPGSIRLIKQSNAGPGSTVNNRN
ncbi:MAG: glycosyltransferase family 2 protein [Clostridia bacterium]|nr:glycosyltransferase family 2 protein [Clostridia bacterium]